ncbi:CPBP family intramembrane glutamic endopeptidase [Synechococcus sp. KORDI-52]|uniref:CPBP family intramembrane glutamic endopeptidase n=1 Tax=Synechococcus sp. KORDI-52 TaxID=585425 RepID=UPI0009FE4AF5|nr:CPBP family intramembrane glutamic endopeptidase [Synechococcus sp. KORDI-52]
MVKSFFQHLKSIGASWLFQRSRWIPIATALPTLYALDLIARKISIQFSSSIATANHDLLSKTISLTIFALILPNWLRIRWNKKDPWSELGLRNVPRLSSLTYFLTGLCIAAAFLLKICIAGLGGSWANWISDIEISKLVNALVLGISMGMAAEIVFRGWLWGELNLLIGPQRALPAQAIIFSLFFTDPNIQGIWKLGSIVGLFLFAMVLAIRRRQNQYSLWGSIGLHGGLAGGWHALQSGLLDWSPTTPLWLIGPQNKPIAGLAGISALCVLIFFQLITLSRSSRKFH